MFLFLILSHKILPHIHLSILISAAFILLTRYFLAAQHYVPYNIAGLVAVR